MNATICPVRCVPAVAGLLAVLVVLAVLAVPVRAWAQAPGAANQSHSRYLAEEDRGTDQHAAFLHLATGYTESALIGLLTGGLLMNRLVGGSAATMIGAVAGTALACWIALEQAKGVYIVREVR